MHNYHSRARRDDANRALSTTLGIGNMKRRGDKLHRIKSKPVSLAGIHFVPPGRIDNYFAAPSSMRDRKTLATSEQLNWQTRIRWVAIYNSRIL